MWYRELALQPIPGATCPLGALWLRAGTPELEEHVSRELLQVGHRDQRGVYAGSESWEGWKQVQEFHSFSSCLLSREVITTLCLRTAVQIVVAP